LLFDHIQAAALFGFFGCVAAPSAFIQPETTTKMPPSQPTQRRFR
jgi:hypothetical protein